MNARAFESINLQPIALTSNAKYLTQDIKSWEKLCDAERYFFSHVSVYCADSDGVANENPAMQLLAEIQMPEARAFLVFQMPWRTSTLKLTPC